MKRAILVLFTVAALVAVTVTMSSLWALADEGRGGGRGECSYECNTQSGSVDNINVWGSQQNQQGSNKVQQDNDTGVLTDVL